jgi:hypothetical protein
VCLRFSLFTRVYGFKTQFSVWGKKEIEKAKIKENSVLPRLVSLFGLLLNHHF